MSPYTPSHPLNPVIVFLGPVTLLFMALLLGILVGPRVRRPLFWAALGLLLFTGATMAYCWREDARTVTRKQEISWLRTAVKPGTTVYGFTALGSPWKVWKSGTRWDIASERPVLLRPFFSSTYLSRAVVGWFSGHQVALHRMERFNGWRLLPSARRDNWYSLTEGLPQTHVAAPRAVTPSPSIIDSLLPRIKASWKLQGDVPVVLAGASRKGVPTW